MVGVGSAGQVYEVHEDVVLKTGRIYEPPTTTTSPLDMWFYASESICHFNILQNEKRIYRLLERHPHPNIAAPIDIHPEGIYLRRYSLRPEIRTATQTDRILWYRDILRGLIHLHNLGIAHSDLRMDNVLSDTQGRAIICDFSASCPFGQPNLVSSSPGHPIPINGPAKILSDATDRFALASLMFRLETGCDGRLSVDNDNHLLLPEITKGHKKIGLIIKKAWIGNYSSTSQMLDDIDILENGSNPDAPRDLTSKDMLRTFVRQWRDERIARYGCVLFALPTEQQMRQLADQHKLEMIIPQYGERILQE